MSFRDLRNFSEHLRMLGFLQTVSMESFREPNFPLVADLLKWLVERFDPEAILDGSINSMEERIMIIRSAAMFMATKANIKLNTKKLYGADGYAVRELLKVTSVLYDALNTNNEKAEDVENQEDSSVQYDISAKINEIKRARQLTTEITANGAVLYDLLSKEPEYKEQRDQSVSRQLDMAVMETSIRQAVSVSRAQIESVREQIENVAASEASLDSKIEKKRAELDRAEKRLQAMQKIKPSFQSEFKQLELEIDKLFDEYVLKYRCIESLKQQLSVLERAEAEAAEEQQKAAIKLMQKYEAEDVLGNVSDSEDSTEEKKDSLVEKEIQPATRPRTRLRIKTAANRGQSRVFGSMGGGSLDDTRDELDDVLDEDADSEESEDFLSDELDLPESRYGARNQTRGLGETRAALGNSMGRHTDDNDDDNDEDDNDDDDLKVLDGDDMNSLASSEESELQLGVGSVASARASVTRRRAPSTKPQPALHDILSDEEF